MDDFKNAKENIEDNFDRGTLENGPEEFISKHGNPSYSYLQSLVDDGNPRAIEILTGIADDFNVAYNEETSPEELVGLIVLAQKNE